MSRLEEENKKLRDLVSYYTGSGHDEDDEDDEEDEDDDVMGQLRNLTKPPRVGVAFYTGNNLNPMPVNWDRLRGMTR